MQNPGRKRRYSRSGKSLYLELGIEKSATNEEISKAYKRLALRYHPDKNPGIPESLEKFQEINKAHKILTDPTKRQIYDKYGSLGLQIAESQQITDINDVKLQFWVSSLWFRILAGFCFFTTLCCCCFCLCCCCKCCCGHCCKNLTKEDEDHHFPRPEDLAEEEIREIPGPYYNPDEGIENVGYEE